MVSISTDSGKDFVVHASYRFRKESCLATYIDSFVSTCSNLFLISNSEIPYADVQPYYFSRNFVVLIKRDEKDEREKNTYLSIILPTSSHHDRYLFFSSSLLSCSRQQPSNKIKFHHDSGSNRNIVRILR